MGDRADLSGSTAPPVVRSLVDFGLIGQAPWAMFENVEARVFPLLADRKRLQYFVDHYYNRTLRETGGRIEVVAPVVLLTVLFYPTIYGRERAEAAVTDQHEYYFLIPVECRWPGPHGETRTIGVVTPYIYVSSPISVPMGRELYGWQKSIYKLPPVLPVGARTMTFEPYLRVERPMPGAHGLGLRYRPVFEVSYRRRDNPLRLGGPGPQVLRLLGELPHATALLSSVVGEELLGDRRGPPPREQLRDLGLLLRDVLVPGRRLDVFALVQVPDPSIRSAPGKEPHFAAAYQAFMRTQLEVNNLHELSFLGEHAPSPLDPSSGFSVHIHGGGIDQVATRLGLRAWQQHVGEEDLVDGEFRPFVPPVYGCFDMEIVGLTTLARRTTRSAWVDEHGERLGRVPPANSVAAYNSWLGPSTAEGFRSYGHTPQALTYKLLGMRADLDALERLCREIAPTPPGVELRPRRLGDDGVVVMVASLAERDHGEQTGLTWFSGVYIEFYVLAKLSFEGRSRLVLLETHGFTDNPHAMLVGRELLAANRWIAQIEESTDWWRSEGSPGRLIRLRTAVLQTVNSGERIEEQVLLDVQRRGRREGDGEQHHEYEPLLAELFRAGQAEILRISTVPTINAGRLTTAMLRCNMERVCFGGARQAPRMRVPSCDALDIKSYESLPLVHDLGLRGRTHQTGVRVDGDFEASGSFERVLRHLETLYDWTPEGWSYAKLRQFLDPRSD